MFNEHANKGAKRGGMNLGHILFYEWLVMRVVILIEFDITKLPIFDFTVLDYDPDTVKGDEEIGSKKILELLKFSRKGARQSPYHILRRLCPCFEHQIGYFGKDGSFRMVHSVHDDRCVCGFYFLLPWNQVLLIHRTFRFSEFY